MKTSTLTIGAALAVAAVLPSTASAHKAVCTPEGYKSVDRYVLLGVDANGKATWGDGWADKTVYPVCPTVPVPPKPEVVPGPAPDSTGAVGVPPNTPPVVGTPPVRAFTCAELRALYPKAGKVRLKAWGCLVPATPINLPGPDKPPRKVTTRYYPCVVGGRPKKVVTVVTASGKVGKVITYGKICKSPGVTG